MIPPFADDRLLSEDEFNRGYVPRSDDPPNFDDLDEDFMAAIEEVAASIPQTRGNGKDASAGNARVRPPLFRSFRELVSSSPRQTWLINGRIERPSTGGVIGASGAGKTFAVIDLAAAVATSGTWAGRDVAAGPVLYLAQEDRLGVLRRFRAWELHYETMIPGDRLFVSTMQIALDEAGGAVIETEVQEIMEKISAAPVLAIIDTCNRSFPVGADENSAKDMTAFLGVVDRLRDRFGCVVLVVHHVGHQEPNRARGSSSFRAALDFELLVSKREGGHIVKFTKLKNLADDPRPMEFGLEKVLIDADAETGEFITSGVVSWRDHAAAKAGNRTTAAEDLAIRTLKEAIGPGGGATLEAWRPLFYAGHSGDNPDSKQKAFRRVRDNLIAKNLVRVENDIYSIVSTGYGIPPCSRT